METFGELIRTARKARHMTLAELALEMGWSVPYMSDLERGNRLPVINPANITGLARILHVPEYDLLRYAIAERNEITLYNDKCSPEHPENIFLAKLAQTFYSLTDADMKLIEETILNKYL